MRLETFEGNRRRPVNSIKNLIRKINREQRTWWPKKEDHAQVPE